MEGLTAFVSKFDNGSPNEATKNSPVLLDSRRDALNVSTSNSPVLPFSIEGILGRTHEQSREDTHSENRHDLKQGTLKH